MNAQALHTRLPDPLRSRVVAAARKAGVTVSAWISCACAHALHYKMRFRYSHAPRRGRPTTKEKLAMRCLLPFAILLLAGCGSQAQIDTLTAEDKLVRTEREHQDQLLDHVLTDWRTEARAHEQDLFDDAIEEIHIEATTPDTAIAMTRAATDHHYQVLAEIEAYYADVVISHQSGLLLRADRDRLLTALRKNLDAGALSPTTANAMVDLVDQLLAGTLKEPRPWAKNWTDSSPTTRPPDNSSPK